MSMFWNRKPKKLVTITHARSHREQKTLIIRLAFEDRKPLTAIVSHDVVEGLARTFNSLATAVRDSRSGASEVDFSQPSLEFYERARGGARSARLRPDPGRETPAEGIPLKVHLAPACRVA